MATEEINKHVDESWKDAAAKQKQKVKGGQGPEEDLSQEASFSFFISTLALQASIFLGQVPNPVTNKKEKNLTQAKFIIDTMDMLKEKTKNNLNQEENNLLDNVLYQLKMQYVNESREVK